MKSIIAKASPIKRKVAVNKKLQYYLKWGLLTFLTFSLGVQSFEFDDNIHNLIETSGMLPEIVSLQYLMDRFG
jgi:hypothetical protein